MGCESRARCAAECERKRSLLRDSVCVRASVAQTVREWNGTRCRVAAMVSGAAQRGIQVAAAATPLCVSAAAGVVSCLSRLVAAAVSAVAHFTVWRAVRCRSCRLPPLRVLLLVVVLRLRPVRGHSPAYLHAATGYVAYSCDVNRISTACCCCVLTIGSRLLPTHS